MTTLWHKCATFEPCDLEHSCALRHLPESQVRQHFYPQTVGINCHHYTPMPPAFKPYGEGPDGEAND